MALEESMKSDEIINVDGLKVALDKGLSQLSRIHGKIRVDYHESRWFGGGFDVRLGVGSCC